MLFDNVDESAKEESPAPAFLQVRGNLARRGGSGFSDGADGTVVVVVVAGFSIGRDRGNVWDRVVVVVMAESSISREAS